MTKLHLKNKDLQEPKKKRKKRKQHISTALFLRATLIIFIFAFLIILLDSRLLNVFYLFTSLWNNWDLNTQIEEICKDEDNFTERLRSLEKSLNVEIEILTKDGDLLYSHDYTEAYTGNYLDKGLIRHFKKLSVSSEGERRILLETDNTGEYEINYFVLSFKTGDGGTINVYTIRNTLDESSRIAIRFMFYMMAAIIFLSLFVIKAFSRRFAAPIEEISEITTKIAAMDFSQKCPPSNYTEISQLSDSVNEMSDIMDATLSEISDKNKKLEDDIRQERTLDHMRANLISSVSHELKTPIAIIQGYAEGLKLFLHEDPEMAEQYCDIIMDETGRMHDLVIKLLEIIKLQSGGHTIDYAVLPLREMTEDWFDRNNMLLSQKEITTENEIPEDFAGRGDYGLIASVINNYISNAVSHIDGERKITVSASDLGEIYRVYIKNTGKNIADKDIDKIWGSFYRADKSMSRAEGRFGLGLTIVQSIQDLHGQKYGVFNVPGGVTFWFDTEKYNKQGE